MPVEPGASFDFDAMFDQDYLDFYAHELHDGASDDEAEVICMLGCIEPGMRVLDLPCGHGRIAQRLAQRGAKVTGIDRSELFLEVARKNAAELGVDVDYQQGDMRTLQCDGEFDLLVNWFTSFGYFEDDVLRDNLRRMHRALAPGGQLLLESMNLHEQGLTDHESSHVKELADDNGRHFMIDRSRYDPNDGRIHTRRFVTREGQPTREIDYQLRLFSVTEIRAWLADAGFSRVQAFGDEGEVFRVDSRRLIVVATR